MKKFILLFGFFSLFLFSQEREELYYYLDKDLLLGVKNKQGKVVIPAQFRSLNKKLDLEHNLSIMEDIICFDDLPKGVKSEPNAFGCCFDRQGNYLHQLFGLDKIPNSIKEGYYRFVKNGKVGFANRLGQEVIASQFDLVSRFNYGYAQACMGCHLGQFFAEWVFIGGTSWVINTKGEKVEPLPNKTSERDVEINGKFYPNPFHYTEKEKKILNFFEDRRDEIASVYSSPKKVYFEIIERPRETFPYYLILCYNYNRQNIGEFLVSEDGNNVYYNNFINGFFDNDTFDTWLKRRKEMMEDESEPIRLLEMPILE